ncbi:MAG: glycosyltransferase [Verrucomicrobia bacterium]|nr:glycosyltransferase [Verrucomicrobiota bacterium]
MPKPSATVAVITRTKDRPVFLIRAIQSVLKQSFQDWLHVIVNDGGDSGTVDALVKCHAHAYGNRVKVIHHAQSKGMQEASNAAIRASESEYVVVHDDDDSWQPDFLQQTTDFLKNCGPDSTTRGVVTQTTQILEEVNSTGEIVELGRHPYIQVDYVTLAEMRKSNLFAPIAFLYRRAAHEQIGLFRQEFDVLGDHDFNLRFLRRFDIGVLPNYSANYHWRHRSMGNTVTAGVEKHRIALSRMKNAYQREYLDNPKEAVGLVDEIPMPPRQRQQDAGPLRIRTKNPLPAKALPNFLEEYSFKLLSLDIFDTALKRRCDHPRNVFALLAEKVAQFLPVTIPGFAALRELAERTARQQQGGEVTLDDIYRNLGQALSLDAATAEKIKAMELAIEDDLLFADPGILSLYKECVQRNIPVIFLSDMYLDSETLACWLEERGFADAKVIVSCEQGLSKHDGGLFEILIQQTGVAAGDILHLGDNLRSDYTRARIAGLQAWHYSQDFCYLPWYKQTEALEFTPGDTLSYRIMGTISKRGTQSPWSCDKVLEKLGYEAAGPLYFAFLHWVLKRAKVDGIKKLILLGRDGYYWEKTLDIFKAHGLCTVEYAYMHASRKVLNFASFKRLDDEAMAFLTTPNPSLRVKDFLSRAGLQPDRHVDAMAAAGFADPEQILTVDLGGSFIRDCYLQQLRVLFQQLEPDLCALFARDRAGVLRSLEQLDFDAKDCAIVDIGWLASSLRRFPAIVDDSGKNDRNRLLFWHLELHGAHAWQHPLTFFLRPQGRAILQRGIGAGICQFHRESAFRSFSDAFGIDCNRQGQ